MEDQIKFYEQMLQYQQQLREAVKKDQMATIRLLTNIDEQISILNDLVVELRALNK
ncbi:hypothetical protein Q0590_33955 [Rhodocytophaga aerolata]|uniref:Uncharacterized protein n=1 Tax=Rhodocytophaga aerolata TaxID=455078 RepID=A0ABT8RIY3_9BACT|nr:hypothetical protein [Rhodocytophaga aerolata]MDO1451329.1 hypothetical protein [Rhodocytophaga aerolata]